MYAKGRQQRGAPQGRLGEAGDAVRVQVGGGEAFAVAGLLAALAGRAGDGDVVADGLLDLGRGVLVDCHGEALLVVGLKRGCRESYTWQTG